MAMHKLSMQSRQILKSIWSKDSQDDVAKHTERKSIIKLVPPRPSVVIRVSGFTARNVDTHMPEEPPAEQALRTWHGLDELDIDMDAPMTEESPVQLALRALEGSPLDALAAQYVETDSLGDTVSICATVESEDSQRRPPTRGKMIHLAKVVNVYANGPPLCPKLRDPDTARRGHYSGRQMTTAIMSGQKPMIDIDMPVLSFLKIHEIRALKKWLAENTTLSRSGIISRMEKLLQLIFLLQYGCRFERIASWFSCTPRTAQKCCMEVFIALLELHRRTSFPKPSECPLYMSKWGALEWSMIASRRPKEVMRRSLIGHYPWSRSQLLKVIQTLNIWIGRYRAQGQSALFGPVFPWGDVKQTGVKRIETLHQQTAPAALYYKGIDREELEDNTAQELGR
ncbi:hypothetical protein GQ43DRAFT_460024 [Delitschia confertaspora ATCC 74209]|uniref:Uncharacterized protein n=1 Tax=Delitschia confertaspora ATCC 74209 TaxID=1513339 RepID=A0A9P4N2Z9_9PLEO|nr:hypothetical protein GQ43DRAFT_460024 [Delitschia confertaspora ATCC 74209]